MQPVTVGLDIAKNVFHAYGVDAHGEKVLSRELRRAKVEAFFAGLKPCLVGIEACATAHHWARTIEKLGHRVRLMPPAYVKPYVKTQKNDEADAEAICEAVTRPNMRFAETKTVEQQSVLVLHRTRAMLITHRTRTGNTIRAHLAEFGITESIGRIGLSRLIDVIVSGEDPQFRSQDLRDEVAALTAKFEVAKAAQQSAELALKSQIGGVNTTVVQNQSELDNAKWELEQTTVRAPADGFVTAMALTVGDRALQFHSAMSFIVADGIRIVGMFAPNGFQTIKPGAPVILVFDNNPGRIYRARIMDIPRGIGEGQIAVSGTLARDGAIGGATAYPAVISIPEDMDVGQLRLGMPGTATVFADNAGVIGLISKILIWINSYTAYL